MQNLFLSIIATLSLTSIIIYDFLCLCRILKKEVWVEKICMQYFPNFQYDETKVFLHMKSYFLWISYLTFILSEGLLWNILPFKILLACTWLFPFGCILRKSYDDRKKEKKTQTSETDVSSKTEN